MTTRQLRTLAVDIGYRMLGARVEAEDIAQETMLRVQGPLAVGDIDNPEAYVTTVATRLAIDELRKARRQREQYVGPWLPEPIVEPEGNGQDLADSLSYALMVVLEALSPLERAAFLLHDVFDYGYDEVAVTLERTPVACRQLASRARRRVVGHRPQESARRADHVRLVERFLAAASGADVDGLVELLVDDVELISDGGAQRRAARHPIVGRSRVVRFLRSVFPRLVERGVLRAVMVNGDPGFIVEGPDHTELVGVVDVSVDRITRILWVVNPDKIGGPNHPGQ